MKTLIAKNYVFISGLLSSLALVLQQAIVADHIDWKAIAFACLVSILGFIANQWKAKGLTVTGLIGSVSGALYTLFQRGDITISELILASLVAILTTMSSGLSAYAPQQPKQP